MNIDRIEEAIDTGPDWSISRLQTIMSCGRRYQYKYIDKVEEPKTPPLAFGSAVHKCIEQMHLNNKWEDGDMQRMWNEEWYAAQDGIDWDKTNYRRNTYDNKGIKILETYRDEHSNDEWYALEASFRFDPGNGLPTLRGMFDKVQRLHLPDMPEMDGRLAVVDYKTSKNPPDPLLLKVDPQLTIYHRAAKELLGEDVVVVLHHLLTAQSYINTRTDKDFEGVAVMLRRGVQRVSDEEFERNVSWNCKYCPFKEDCLGKLANGEP